MDTLKQNNVSIIEGCTGCGLCSFVCPKNAIEIVENPEKDHFIYPKIDNLKCINCGLCLKQCPTASTNGKPLNVDTEVYYYKHHIEEMLLKSTSGGAFQGIVQSLYNGNCAIYGASWDGLKVKHKRITKLDELDSLLSSKYIQSYIDRNIYHQIKKDVDDGMRVIFSGTPCQVAAVACLLEKNRDDVYLIEIICHGVPNQWGFDKCIEYEEKRISGKIINFAFRYKNSNYESNRRFKMEFSKLNKRYKLVADHQYFPFYLYFYTYSIYRDSCYNCKFRKNRYGDILIGDFWGATKLTDFVKSNWSNSVAVPLTKKGIEIMSANGVKTLKTIKEISAFNKSVLYDGKPDIKYIDFYKKLVSYKNYKNMVISPNRTKINLKIKNIVKVILNIFLPKYKRKPMGKTFYKKNQTKAI